MYMEFVLHVYSATMISCSASQLVRHLHIVMVQGVLEAIRISCAGYPTKRTFDEFIDRFGMLAPELVDRYEWLAGIYVDDIVEVKL